MSRPKPTFRDGEVGVERIQVVDEVDHLAITLRDAGVRQRIVCSEWNARRLLGMLATMLDVPLAPAVAKRIDMHNPYWEEAEYRPVPKKRDDDE